MTIWKDHLGNDFPSLSAMAAFYGLKPCTLVKRLDVYGYSLEKALTAPLHGASSTPAKDHTGCTFPSLAAMARTWGLSSDILHNRLDVYGGDVEKALTVPRRGYQKGRMAKPCIDHKGVSYASYAEMAKAYGLLPRVFYCRHFKYGWSIERSLNASVHRGNSRPVTDHTGRAFPSVTAMTRAWGVRVCTFNARRRKGWDLEKSLTYRSKSHE